jgi:hypothetical protein
MQTCAESAAIPAWVEVRSCAGVESAAIPAWVRSCAGARSAAKGEG